ncbi:hypothetical protein KC867_02635 [Candidatus Saccharibacteria bacterium]|nr:hypothetical protein [Candidatus Saccharibacteria bacterium]
MGYIFRLLACLVTVILFLWISNNQPKLTSSATGNWFDESTPPSLELQGSKPKSYLNDINNPKIYDECSHANKYGPISCSIGMYVDNSSEFVNDDFEKFITVVDSQNTLTTNRLDDGRGIGDYSNHIFAGTHKGPCVIRVEIFDEKSVNGYVNLLLQKLVQRTDKPLGLTDI